ncbi:MAG TPA: diguanylate cyclase, partial [Bryobacteraceae bacterium]|nr:diguanylate cyclase [Bryobacteraceae bacterium]
VSCAQRRAGTTVRFGADNAPPYTTIGPGGEVTGLSVDIISEAARRRGITILWVPVRQGSVEEALQSKQVDAWSAFSRTPDREKRFHFTQPWIEATYCLLSRKDNNPSSPATRIAVKNASAVGGLAARLFARQPRIAEPNNIAAIDAVCRKDADAAFVETRVLDAILLNRPRGCDSMALAVHFVAGAESPVSIASLPSAAATVDAIRAEIPSLAADETFAAALDRWAGASAGQARSILALRHAQQKGRIYLFGLALLSALGLLLFWQTWRARAAHARARTAQIAAAQSEKRFAAFMHNSPALAYVKDSAGRLLYINAALQKVLNVKRSDWEGKTDAELWPPEFARQLRSNDLEVINTGRTLELIERAPSSSGEIREFLSVKFPFLSAAGESMVGGMSIDITASRRAEEALRLSEERYRSVVESASDIIYQTDSRGQFTFYNQAALKILGYSETEVVGKSYLTLIHPDQRPAAAAFYGRQFVRRKPETYFEFRCLTSAGEERWLGQTVRLLLAAGKPSGFQAIARDITERKLLERKLEWQATHDALTGLPNRRNLIEELEREVEKAERRPARLVVSMCDIDCFKRINDTYGHAAGDEALQSFAARLRQGLRQSDTVGRIAGDEFCIILHDTSYEHACACIERVREEVRMLTFEAGEVLYGVTASFGLAAWRKGATAKDLLAAADRALYSAKSSGKNCIAGSALPA